MSDLTVEVVEGGQSGIFGLAFHRKHDEHLTVTNTERLESFDELRKVREAIGEFLNDRNPCPYTQSHTREWCGYEDCRES